MSCGSSTKESNVLAIASVLKRKTPFSCEYHMPKSTRSPSFHPQPTGALSKNVPIEVCTIDEPSGLISLFVAPSYIHAISSMTDGSERCHWYFTWLPVLPNAKVLLSYSPS